MSTHKPTRRARSVKKRATRLANRKLQAEIKQIDVETALMRKRYRLEVAKVMIAVGGLSATVVTVLNAILGP
ncbi:MAG: hypothetical protein RJS97_23415 [Parvibaculaceae bacterium]